MFKVNFKNKERTYSIGDCFYDESDGFIFMIARVQSNTVKLICLNGPSYYSSEVRVNDLNFITEDEFDNMRCISNLEYIGKLEISKEPEKWNPAG